MYKKKQRITNLCGPLLSTKSQSLTMLIFQYYYVVFFLTTLDLFLIIAKRRVICRTSKEAIEKGNVIELQRIIQQGENINDVDEKFKFTPLHWASHFGALEV